TVRHGDAQQPRPVPPGHGRDRPGPRPRGTRRGATPGDGGASRLLPRLHPPVRRGCPGDSGLELAGMTMRVLVINSGSATVKLDRLDSDDRVVWRRKGPAATELSDERLATMLREAPEADAVGHRVVHGGEEFTGPTLVDSGVLDRLDAYS